MTGKKTVIFHDLQEARAALAAARKTAAPITLQTAPGAAVYAGVGYLMAVIDQAGADRCEAVIDCGEDAGIALAALRTGWKRLLFTGREEVCVKLAQIAEQQGASVTSPDQ